jgi:hypothetical protein
MTVKNTPATVVGDLATLVGDFERSLLAAKKAPRTVKICGDSARWPIRLLQDQGMATAAEKVGREHLEAFAADQLTRFKAAALSVAALPGARPALQMARRGR